MEDAPGLRAVLEDVYAALGLEWDPATAGGVADEAPGVDVEDVREALLAGYGRRYELSTATLDEDELARAGELLDRHRVAV